MNQAYKSKFARTTPAPKSEPAGERDWWVYRGEWEEPKDLAGPFGSEAIARRQAEVICGGCIPARKVRGAEISERSQVLSRYIWAGRTLWIGGAR